MGISRFTGAGDSPQYQMDMEKLTDEILETLENFINIKAKDIQLRDLNEVMGILVEDTDWNQVTQNIEKTREKE